LACLKPGEKENADLKKKVFILFFQKKKTGGEIDFEEKFE
jgi:hypothetical protein